MEYTGYIARQLALAAESFEEKLSQLAHGDDFWELKKMISKFKKDMQKGGEQSVD